MAQVESKYKPDDTAYIIESNRIIRKVKILMFAGGLYTIQFTDTGGGMKIRESRLFPTEEAAKASIQARKPSQYNSPWD